MEEWWSSTEGEVLEILCRGSLCSDLKTLLEDLVREMSSPIFRLDMRIISSDEVMRMELSVSSPPVITADISVEMGERVARLVDRIGSERKGVLRCYHLVASEKILFVEVGERGSKEPCLWIAMRSRGSRFDVVLSRLTELELGWVSEVEQELSKLLSDRLGREVEILVNPYGRVLSINFEPRDRVMRAWIDIGLSPMFFADRVYWSRELLRGRSGVHFETFPTKRELLKRCVGIIDRLPISLLETLYRVGKLAAVSRIEELRRPPIPLEGNVFTISIEPTQRSTGKLLTAESLVEAFEGGDLVLHISFEAVDTPYDALYDSDAMELELSRDSEPFGRNLGKLLA